MTVLPETLIQCGDAFDVWSEPFALAELAQSNDFDREEFEGLLATLARGEEFEGRGDGAFTTYRLRIARPD